MQYKPFEEAIKRLEAIFSANKVFYSLLICYNINSKYGNIEGNLYVT